jgi:hypothetical protein
MQETNFEEDASQVVALPASLEQVSALALQMIEAENKVDTLTEQLKEAQKELSRIESADLPDVMESLGLSEFTLTNHYKIKVKPIIKASLPAPSSIENSCGSMRESLLLRLNDGIKYLNDHGAGAMVKNLVSVELGKDSNELAEKIIKVVEEHCGVRARQSVSVHPQTLSSYVKEKIEEGLDIPLETFGVFTGRKATITKPKQ